MAKRVVLELGSSTNFVYSLKAPHKMRGFLCWACSYRALTICFKSAAVSGFLRSSRIFAVSLSAVVVPVSFSSTSCMAGSGAFA